MSIRVLPCDFEDLPTCSSIQWSACSSNTLWQIHFPNGGTPDLQRWTTYHMQCEFDSPNIHLKKAVDQSASDEEIIGYARWTVKTRDLLDQHALQNAQEGRRDISNSRFLPPDVPEEDSNDECFNRWMPEVLDIRHRYMNGKQVIMLDDLFVLPDHQGRGAGTLLLKNLVDFADERGLPCYLESTPSGHETYTRQGFREIETVEINLEEWRHGSGVNKTAIMYRDERTLQKYQVDRPTAETREDQSAS
ncbi:MAG: hypothetical protein Q9219_000849 [cf. Caloplaca sp. 3 TL-2023]